MLNEALALRTRAEWEERFVAAGVPAGPVQSVAEALTHPQSRHLNMVVDAATAAGGTRPMLGFPIHFGGRNVPAVSAAPRLGQHTLEVLSEFDFSSGEIDALLDEGAIHQTDSARDAVPLAEGTT